MKKYFLVLALAIISLPIFAVQQPLTPVTIRGGGFTVYDTNGVPLVKVTGLTLDTSSLTNLSVTTATNVSSVVTDRTNTAYITAAGELLVNIQTLTAAGGHSILIYPAYTNANGAQYVVLTNSSVTVSNFPSWFDLGTNGYGTAASKPLYVQPTVSTNYVRAQPWVTNISLASYTGNDLVAGDAESAVLEINNVVNSNGSFGELTSLTYTCSTNTTAAQTRCLKITSTPIASWPANSSAYTYQLPTNIVETVSLTTNSGWTTEGTGMSVTVPLRAVYIAPTNSIFVQEIAQTAHTNGGANYIRLTGYKH